MHRLRPISILLESPTLSFPGAEPQTYLNSVGEYHSLLPWCQASDLSQLLHRRVPAAPQSSLLPLCRALAQLESLIAPSLIITLPLTAHPLHPHMIYCEALYSHFPMAATSEAILLGNGMQVVDLHKDPPPSQYYIDDIESIQDHLDSLINDLSSDWKGSIPFCCHVINNNDQVREQILEDPPPMIDTCDYPGGLIYPAIKLQFSPITYPPPKSNIEMSSSNSEACTGWTALSRDLAVAAHAAGNSIIWNGSQKSQQDMNCNYVFKCGTFHRTTRTTAMELTDDCRHRITSP